MGRRKFLTSLALAGAAAVVQGFLTACGGGTAGGNTVGPVHGGDCQANGGEPTVLPASGHTHSMPAIAAGDIAAGTSQIYTTGVSSGHSHTVTVSSGGFATLSGDQGIEVVTDADASGHRHNVVINCG